MTTKATEHTSKGPDRYGFVRSFKDCTFHFGAHMSTLEIRPAKGQRIGLTVEPILRESIDVHHETGLTPRQLADHREELLEALEKVRCLMIEISCEGQPMTEAQAKQVVSTCHFAISRATGK